MTVEFFEDCRMRPATEAIVTKANEIIREYSRTGLVLSLRQLYYQFVARALIPNTERSYKNLGRVITKARMGGLLSWTAIEDRGRGSYRVQGETEPSEVLRGIQYGLVIDPWRDQDHYVEVWVEKEALVNVIERPCSDFRVTRMACKGYLSASTLWRAAKRLERARSEGKHPVIVHLGDHDPSGLDMTRDNGDRASILSNGDVEIRRIALNMDQIEEHQPPPNPTKLSDSRAGDYLKAYGESSWELDALNPGLIDDLIRREVDSLISDRDAWDEAYSEENRSRELLAELSMRWADVEKFLEEN